MQTLQGWQKSNHRVTPAHVKRVGAIAILVCLLTGFAVLLRSPYERPGLQIAIVAPGAVPAVAQASKTGSNALAPASVESDNWQALDRDVAGMLCYASGQRLLQIIDEKLPLSCLKRPVDAPLNQQAEWLSAELTKSLRPHSTLVVYVAGVLSIENNQPAVCCHTHAASHGGGELLLLPMLESLKKTKCKQILLCIDLVTPSNASLAVMTTPLMIDELTESLERSLASYHASTPMAVCIDASSPDQVVRTGRTATPLATALMASVQAEVDVGNFNLHRLKARLVSGTTNQASLPDSIWLTSNHWPATSDTIRLPTVHTKTPEPTSALAAESISETSTTPTSSTQTISPENANVDQLSVEQLWQVGKQAIDRLDRVDGSSDDQPAAAWLPLPARLSYRQRHPFTSAWLEHLWNDLSASRQLSVVEPSSDTLRGFVKYLHSLSPGQRLPEGPSTQNIVTRSPWQDVHLRTTNSLLINATLGRLGIVDSAAGASAQQMLGQLTRAIDQAKSSQECKALIQKLYQNESASVESEQCLALCDSGLGWSTLQRVLRLQLVSFRAHLDLFQNHPEVQSLLQDADECSRQVRQELDLRPDSHLDSELDLLVERGLGLYHAALARMTTMERSIHQRNRLISDSLDAHAWTNVTSISSKETQKSLQSFAQQWKSLPGQFNIAAVEEQCQQAQRLLRDSNAERSKQMDSIRQLNRSVLAAAESRVTELTSLKNSGLLQTDGTFEAGALRLFLNLVSSQRTHSAPAWTASHSASTLPSSSWLAEKLEQLVEANAEYVLREMQGATALEMADLQRRLTIWDRIAGELVSQGILVTTRSSRDQSLMVDAPVRIDVQRNAFAALPCAIKYETAAAMPPQLKAEYDEQSLDVRLGNESLHSGATVDLPSNGLMDDGDANKALSTSKVVLTVKRNTGRTVTEPIILLVSQGDAQRRAVVHLTTPQPTMVDVQLVASDSPNDLTQESQPRASCILWPNRQQPIGLQLTNQKLSTLQTSVQVWGTEVLLTDWPVGTVTEASGQQWLHGHPGLVPLAQAPDVVIDARSQQRITLVPSAVGPDFKKSPLSCRGILIGVTDRNTKSMQFEFCDLRVRHPHNYTEQEVALDAERQCVLITTRLNGVFGTSAALVQHRLIDWPSANLIAQSESQLSGDVPSGRIVLSYSRSRADRIALVTHVDGWPGVWVKVIDRAGTHFIDEPVAHVSLRCNLQEGILPATGAEAFVDVDAWSSIPANDAQINFQIGWDRNQDRTLMAETPIATRSLSTIAARFHGVDATGMLQIEGRVEPPRVVLPLAGLSNERASLLAVVKRDNHILAQADMTVVIDRQPPLVVKTQVENGNRALQGVPSVIHVETDDRGLAGVARVEASWALDGRMDLTDDMKPVPAILRPDGRWTLTLPTAVLPLGENVLLVRAVDKAGNCSETYSVNLRMHSQAELDEMAASATSSVTGTLMFARLPQNGLHVELFEAANEEEKRTDGMAKESTAAQTLVADTMSQADGTFRLDRVRSGKYELRVSGIVRGMKMQRTRQVVVAAPKNVAPILWRLDTQP